MLDIPDVEIFMVCLFAVCV